MLRGHTQLHERLRDRLAAIALVTIGLDLVFAALAYLFEHGFSTGGRILDVIMEIYAITVVGTVAGSLGAFFVGPGRQR